MSYSSQTIIMNDDDDGFFFFLNSSTREAKIYFRMARSVCSHVICFIMTSE